MDVLKAGAEKVKETVSGKKTEEHLEKATDPNRPASDRVDHALQAGKSKLQEDEHAAKADSHAADHKYSH
ncbi:unnamed protein product [Didymodactylos carnosus]|uniref:Uncharacterized protein n=1 Tax=Didymodactylos carnosus TaxID=1234261 RepID=A0A813UPT8_9BILA|nr:unnamed protein product [Didymodactylos carnosus]CAF0829841.1 unnamed protein product [Didymodactylos carnosus]CAF3554576.1 unnamed protein product [Didymodactylos carnosus]CAF3616870.1 unnamed protein product [Didymodactylos carnosus]